MRAGQRGFTLIEIMMVVIIIGILAAWAIPSFTGRGEQARRSAAQADVNANLGVALDLFEMDLGRYPTTQEGLKALIEKPSTLNDSAKWNGPYLKKKMIPLDPWGHAYVYVAPGVHNKDGYDLSSWGADGTESNDDVTSWAEGEAKK